MGLLNAGDMDREVTIEQRSLSTGTPDPVETWTTWATVWARRLDRTGMEVFRAGREEREGATVFRLRWIAGLSAEMRLVEDGVVYDIQSIAELGRREGWDVLATRRGD
ncbi:MAG TPA: phage head closure protein [Kiloniellales bacterium]